MDVNKHHLEIHRLSLNFGGVQALNQVDLEVKREELFSLIGPNGAGKTSLINCVSKFYRPNEGKIIFNSHEITNLRPYEVARCGISRTFQNIELFRAMTVLDNIKLGRHIHLKSGPLAGLIYLGKAKKEEQALEAFLDKEILDFLGLTFIKNQVVSTLPYGLQKRIDLEFLILDEPVAGMNREETRDMITHILEVKKAWKLTILLIEHDMEVVMNISARIAVMDFGQKIAEGTAEEIQRNPDVIRIYLGRAYAHKKDSC
jgi:branched-chain amino acid transport system ATP-binding protein